MNKYLSVDRRGTVVSYAILQTDGHYGQSVMGGGGDIGVGWVGVGVEVNIF